LAACEEAARAQGYRALALVATMPGVPLYERYGFRLTEPREVRMPDGTMIACAAMEKPIDQG
jgi:predicted N-acetyltransferase YhbS